MPKMTGKCLCGRIQYSCDAEPVVMMACHCKDCQRQTGSAFLTAVAVPNDTITVSGDLRTYTQPGGTTGLPMHRRFCPQCGSQVLLEREQSGRIYIMAGTLDDTSFVRPERSIFCESKQAWVPLPPDIPSYPRALQ
jgi:hypothetical protein